VHVVDVCSKKVVTIRPGDEISVAARRMREAHVGYLVVVDADPPAGTPRVLGVLTDRDIVIGVVSQNADPRTVLVRDAMTRDPVMIRSFDSLPTAITMMRQRGVRRTPVIDKLGALVGVLSLDDLLDALATDLANLAGAVRTERRVESMTRT